MMQKDKKLVIAFLVILFGICLCIPCKFVLVKIGVMSMNMDNFLEYKEKDVNNVVDKINNVIGRIENSVENKVTNYFPFYNVINSLYDKVDFTSNKILFKDVPIKKNSDGEYIFYDKVNEFYYLTNKYTSKELDERLDSQVKFFNNLNKKGIDVNIYIPTRYEFTTLKKDNLSNYVGEFVSKLDSNINVRVMDVKSIDEYKEYFYKKYSLFLNGLYKIKQGDKVRIWISQVPMEMVGFFVVCYFLRDVLNSIFVCDANIILHDISKHTVFLNCPTDFIQLMNKMENVPVLKYSEIGEKIFLTDKTIKLIKNGEVIMMNEKDLDRLIYDVINSQKGNNTERIIEEVSKKSLINYLYLYKKVRKIIVE